MAHSQRRAICRAMGRPHPGSRYIWTSTDSSIASVEPFLNDGGAEHPNRANVVGPRPRHFSKLEIIFLTLDLALESILSR